MQRHSEAMTSIQRAMQIYEQTLGIASADESRHELATIDSDST
jgi:hypothetical protein